MIELFVLRTLKFFEVSSSIFWSSFVVSSMMYRFVVVESWVANNKKNGSKLIQFDNKPHTWIAAHIVIHLPQKHDSQSIPDKEESAGPHESHTKTLFVNNKQAVPNRLPWMNCFHALHYGFFFSRP